MTSSPRRDSFSLRWSESEAAQLGRNQLDVELTTLDRFVAGNEGFFPQPDCIKIDAEGWDLEIIRGGEKTISKAEVVLLEAGVMNKSFKNTVRNVINEMCKKTLCCLISPI